jgi:hypothetical protein
LFVIHVTGFDWYKDNNLILKLMHSVPAGGDASREIYIPFRLVGTPAERYTFRSGWWGRQPGDIHSVPAGGDASREIYIPFRLVGHQPGTKQKPRSQN